MRQTEEAYRKGLVQGYALAKAQYEEMLRELKSTSTNKNSTNTTNGGSLNVLHGNQRR